MTRVLRQITVLAALFIFGIVYNATVKWLEDKDYHDGYVAYLVVFGTAVTIIGYGLLAGADAALKAFYCFAASGLPMVVGSCWRHIKEAERIKRDARQFAGGEIGNGNASQGGRHSMASPNRGDGGTGRRGAEHC